VFSLALHLFSKVFPNVPTFVVIFVAMLIIFVIMSLDQEKIKFAILYFFYNIEKIFSLLSVLTIFHFQLFWMILGSARGLASSGLGMSRSSKQP
jgi:hypothetical protein